MDRWEGRVAIVTGASSGIGAAIARLLAEKGMKVVAVARRIEKLKLLEAEQRHCRGKIFPQQCDVTNDVEITKVVKWTRENLGGADVLVNSAGVARETKLICKTAPTAEIQKILDTNVLAICLFDREVIKDMRDRGIDDGHIFHIGSVAGQRMPDLPSGYYVYSCTKHAVRVLTEGLRRELRDIHTKIRVTSISPGLVRTELMFPGASSEFLDEYYRQSPALEPKDVAEALLYALCTRPQVQVHEITIEPVGEKF